MWKEINTGEWKLEHAVKFSACELRIKKYMNNIMVRNCTSHERINLLKQIKLFFLFTKTFRPGELLY